jgi:hypothetical protein
LSQAVGILDFTDKFYKDWQEAYDKNPALSPSKFQANWIKENKLSAFTDKAYAETPVRGALPEDWRDAKPGTYYVLEPGKVPGITSPTVYTFVGIDKNGHPQFVKPPKGDK